MSCTGYVSPTLPKGALYPASTPGFATAIVLCFNYGKELTTVCPGPVHSQDDGLIGTVSARGLRRPGVMRAWNLKYDAMR
jgi:hypothetical protein